MNEPVIDKEMAGEMLEAVKSGGILEMAKSGIAKGAAFAGEHGPILIHEILSFNLYKYAFLSLVDFLIVSALAFLMYLLFRVAYRAFSSDSFDDEDSICSAFATAGLIICSLFAITALFSFIDKIMTLIQILVAPRLFLLEYLTMIISGGH